MYIIGKEVPILGINQSSGVEKDSRRKDIVYEEYYALEPPILHLYLPTSHFHQLIHRLGARHTRITVKHQAHISSYIEFYRYRSVNEGDIGCAYGRRRFGADLM